VYLYVSLGRVSRPADDGHPDTITVAYRDWRGERRGRGVICANAGTCRRLSAPKTRFAARQGRGRAPTGPTPYPTVARAALAPPFVPHVPPADHPGIAFDCRACVTSGPVRHRHSQTAKQME